jgi:arsenical pump membrane protein
VTLQNAALPVLAVGVAATVLRRLSPRLDVRVPALLFVLAVGLGSAARIWDGPAQLASASSPWVAAAIGALSSVLVNNLPAAMLLSAQPAGHRDALLLGLDVGPNLAVTGSLSAVLWLQTSRALGARPSVVVYTRLGLVLVPLTLTVALVLQGAVRI